MIPGNSCPFHWTCVYIPSDEFSSMTQTDKICFEQPTPCGEYKEFSCNSNDNATICVCRSRWSHMREITLLSAAFSGPRKSDDDDDDADCIIFSFSMQYMLQKNKIDTMYVGIHTE